MICDNVGIMTKKKPTKKRQVAKRKGNRGSVAGKKRGTPAVPIDWKTVQGMCNIMCTQEEIASVIGVHINTLNNRCKDEHGMTFQEYFDRNSNVGRESIRRAQYRLGVENLNPTMLIWLGKQFLNQTEKTDNTHRIEPPIIIDDITEDDVIDAEVIEREVTV